MTIRTLTISAVLFCAVGANATLFHANLDGLNETPPNASPAFGVLDGSLTGGSGAWVFSYTYSYSGLLAARTAQHFHHAPIGVAGPVVKTIAGAGATSDSGSGTWMFSDVQPLTDALAAEMMAGNIYTNIHTSVFPGGEIRGQLAIVPEPSAFAAAFAFVGGLITLRRRLR